jgi:phosphatidylglycerophosphate synthase
MPHTRRYNVVLAIGLVCTAGLGVIVASWIHAGPAYPLLSAAIFAALFAGVAWVAGKDHPHSRFGPANVVTATRAMLTALVGGLIVHTISPLVLWWVIGTAVAVAVLDGVDGWLARSTRLTSGYGARFDMETDAAFILVLSVLVWQNGKAGVWVLGCGLMRYAFVAAGWILPWVAAPLRPTLRGRVVAVAQFLGLAAALAPAVQSPASAMVAGVTLTALTWSFAIDVAWLWSRRRMSASGARVNW